MPADATVARELAVLLDRRSEELNHFARYLRRSRQQLLEQSSTPRPSDPEPAPRQDESETWREQCRDLQAELSALDARMRERQAELTAECERVRAEADEAASKVQELQAVRESLQREVHDRDVVLEKLRRQLEQQAAQVNLEHSGSYERELNAFRIELERDRQDLNEQLCQLQVRQADMEAAARDSELQMSRKRAASARERADLTRTARRGPHHQGAPPRAKAACASACRASIISSRNSSNRNPPPLRAISEENDSKPLAAERTLRVCLGSPSPPVLRGRGVGVRGWVFCGILSPSPPTPLPRVRGRGELMGQSLSAS